jgi:nicotinamidase-related amidase
MTRYSGGETALLFIDPYNDFLSVGGKLWPHVENVATEVGLIANLRKVTQAVRRAGIQVFIVPHRRFEPGDYEAWDHATPYQRASAEQRVFARGTWGGEWHPEFAPHPEDVIVKEHWGASGFANTDLDFLLKQRGLHKLIVIGLIANTCVEGTSRFAVELGYHVTLVKDATAAFDKDRMRAAHELNGPTFAHAILTADEVVAALTQ